ncbi:MAG: hypothetical protein L0211_13725 [Planctomycetaceae bacterium]|nr:hypothetical protein [Planctomycetaceae bacterium]
MFGDSFARGGVLTASNTVPEVTNTTDVLLAGGSRGLKVAEHNKAIPMNRTYLAYNHFHNAAASSIDVTPLAPVTDNLSIDRWTLGLESRFGEGLWSLEVQMPFTGDLDVVDPGGLAESHSGQIGNLSAILKRLVYYDECTSVVMGLGVEAPTGSDFISRTADVSYLVSNDAVHLHPYLGVLHSPSDCLFFHGFIQVDVATHGNLVTFDDFIASGNIAGRFNDQTLLYADLGGGYWLWRDPCAGCVTGLAVLAEVHYTTTLNDTDTLFATPVGTGGGGHVMNLTSPANRVDVVNLTAAIHAELAQYSSLRVGGVVPLRDPDDRFFDAEVTVQFIQRF